MKPHPPEQQSIGNGYDAQIRSFAPPNASADFFGGSYPGLGGGGFSELPQGGNYPVPYQGGGGGGGGLLNLGGGGGGGSNPLSGINFNQIKGFVDRMGGVDGIIGTMTKVQKFMGTFQQMAPMLRVLFNSFGKAKTSEGTMRRRGKRRPQSGKRRRASSGVRRRPSSR